MADWYIDSSSTDESKQIPYLEDFPPLYSIDDNPNTAWVIGSSDECPTRAMFPTMYTLDEAPANAWLLDEKSECPYKEVFPEMYPVKALPSNKWRQIKGQLPMRPWCLMSKNIHQFVEEQVVIPKIDWSASMQQSYEYYIVNPETWNNIEKIDNVISSSITHDSTSRLFGSSNINTTEQLSENYIRTYLVVNQNGVEHKECLGTFLYMTTSDSFDGIIHTYDAIGYSPLVELEEALPPIGLFIPAKSTDGSIFGTNNVGEIVRMIVLKNSRCMMQPLSDTTKTYFSDDIVPSPTDTWLDVLNSVISAAVKGQYVLGVNDLGEVFFRTYENIDESPSTYTYTDDNSSILLPTVNTSLDLYKIPNVVEIIYCGAGTSFHSIVKNTDPNSIVSTVSRKREIRKRITLFKVAHVTDVSQKYFDSYAATLLEGYSTVSQQISFSHGYCGTKVGDCVTIDYKSAGLENIKGKIISQTINCTPGCTVDETVVYTKKLWNKTDLVELPKET